MSKRLQVLLDEGEFEAIRKVAEEEGLTVSEWVRGVLRRARRELPRSDQARKLSAVRAAARHRFPTADIEDSVSARDAVHIAVMRRHEIDKVLSFDAGFDLVPGVERIS